MTKHVILSVILALFFVTSVGAQKKFNNCGMAGDAKTDRAKRLNEGKNRYTMPSADDIDTTISLEKILSPGDDETRFSNAQAATITGYVFAVKRGGVETCNCHATKEGFQDTHIEIVVDPQHTNQTERMIVEVTPRIKKKMHDKGADWSTNGLKSLFLHKWVRITGWMLFDVEHVYNAQNTNENGDNIWRGTCWEIHPVMSMEVVSGAS